MQPRVRWELKALSPPVAVGDAARSFAIPPAGLTLGRDPASGVAIDGARFPSVSGVHARIAFGADGGPTVEDLGSRHGTLVNGHPVARASLKNGSVLELGAGGPRFVVVALGDLARTAAFPRPTLPRAASELSLGQTAFLSLKKALGIDREAVEHLVTSSRKQSTRTLALVALLILVAVAAGFRVVRERGRAELEQLRRENRELRANLEQRLAANRELAEELQSRISAEERAQATERAEFNAFVEGLRSERAALEERFARFESEGTVSASEFGRLRTELDDAARRLALFDPVQLSEATLSEIGRVRSTVCMVEAVLWWRERETGAALFVAVDEKGTVVLNLEGRGAAFAQKSTGSGFCVSAAGWIVTNAHVVESAEEIESFVIEDIVLEPHVELRVTFSGEETRHAATLWDVAHDERDDLALIKVEPFEGLAHLSDFRIDVPRPSEGSEVFLLGFPLGTHALQEGDKVIASTFKGILSRFVDPYFQVDAGVHPGNSGGPVVDAFGRVLGVVTAGQRTPDDGIAYTIGYAIPIDRLGRIWPPASEPRAWPLEPAPPSDPGPDQRAVEDRDRPR